MIPHTYFHNSNYSVKWLSPKLKSQISKDILCTDKKAESWRFKVLKSYMHKLYIFSNQIAFCLSMCISTLVTALLHTVSLADGNYSVKWLSPKLKSQISKDILCTDKKAESWRFKVLKSYMHKLYIFSNQIAFCLSMCISTLVTALLHTVSLADGNYSVKWLSPKLKSQISKDILCTDKKAESWRFKVLKSYMHKLYIFSNQIAFCLSMCISTLVTALLHTVSLADGVNGHDVLIRPKKNECLLSHA